jgi:hypothetical protein
MTTLTKPFDIALTAIVEATEKAKANHALGSQAGHCFFFRHMPCVVFTTPTGQLRYQVGLHGKPQRRDTEMLRTLTDIEAESQAFAARGTRVPMVADVTYCEGHAPTVMLKGRVMLRLPTTRGYDLFFHVGAMPRGQFGRKEYAGEMVEGPWAFANGAATVISASEAHRNRDAAERAQAIPVQDGTLLVIDNCQYRVEVVRGEWLTLHLTNDFSK